MLVPSNYVKTTIEGTCILCVCSHYFSLAIQVMVSGMLTKIASHNDQLDAVEVPLTRFHSKAPPAISIADYLHRIVQFASIEKTNLLILLVLIDRICENSKFIITSLTAHRFIIAAITVIAKFTCDSYCTNSHYARVGGISTQELNMLEVEFLFLVRWNLFCDSMTLQRYYQHLVTASGFQLVSSENSRTAEGTDGHLETYDQTPYFYIS